jgi:hypothetical protein
LVLENVPIISDDQGFESLVGAKKEKGTAPQTSGIIGQMDMLEVQALKCFIHSEPILHRYAQWLIENNNAVIFTEK